ncbi:hypothetical protein Vretimale_8751 [Volvox reticuliferus]|uniref:Lon N-terminal domain-containing protein n=1 Tax=Volvox reticuliferus TaxID=1737510 RepID=A0A8J4LN21_9CHLO|nr:hypothetical protein Vretimale_8751 [Volvox reticuliferus]
MQSQSCSLCGRLGWGFTRLLSQQRIRGLQSSARVPSGHEGLSPSSDDGPLPSNGAGTTTKLQSVLSIQQGFNTFAAATVTFGPNVHDAEEAAAALGSAAQHAGQVALLALRAALSVHRPPSAVVALPSLELPNAAVQALTEALAEQLGPDTALVGCSSRLRLPDERGLAAGTGTATATSVASGGPLAAAAAAAGLRPQPSPSLSSSSHRYHITLVAAHLPQHEVHAVRCDTSSLPRLPYLAEALQGRRPPAFLLLAASDSLALELLARLENLFPGSGAGAGVAAQQTSRDRRLMLVGPSGATATTTAAAGGAGSSGSSGSGSVGPTDRPTGVKGTGPPSGRAGSDDSMVPSSSPSSLSEFEGHFQRLLLDRDGAATGNSNSSINSAGSGRRRRLPPSSNAAFSRKGDGGGGGSAGERPSSPAAVRDADDVAAPTGEVAAAANHLPKVQTPFLLLNGKVHNSSGALLAIYPKAPSMDAPAAAEMAVQPPPVDLRLDPASCDVMARLALGSSHLLHVILWGSPLQAISPGPTGPEPFTPSPAASENPFYWQPARVTLPELKVLVADSYPDLAPNLDGSDVLASSSSSAATAAATATPSAAVETAAAGNEVAGVAAKEFPKEGGGEGDGERDHGDEDEVEDREHLSTSAVLASLRGGLRWLPVFPLEGAILFPGQSIQLRIFEKRYRLLARACVQQGAAFGLCWRGTGTTAVIRSYQTADDGGGDLMVLLEGGVRFSYNADDLSVLPASYGLNAATRAEYVVDEPPDNEEDVAALLATAHAVLDSVAGALEEATAPSAQQTARTFANALHFASSSSSTSTSSVIKRSSSPLLTTIAAAEEVPSPSHQQHHQGELTHLQKRQPPGDGAALLAEDLTEAKRVMDAETASLLSLYLAPHIPVHLESLRREWFTSRSALWRLQQEAAWLKSSPRVAMAVASSVLRLPRDHPLRIMLGLSRVAAVAG